MQVLSALPLTHTLAPIVDVSTEQKKYQRLYALYMNVFPALETGFNIERFREPTLALCNSIFF